MTVPRIICHTDASISIMATAEIPVAITSQLAGTAKMYSGGSFFGSKSESARDINFRLLWLLIVSGISNKASPQNMIKLVSHGLSKWCVPLPTVGHTVWNMSLEEMVL